MAFVSTENKKELSVGIKEVLKKYGMKGTISVAHYSTLVVKIKAGKLDMIGNMRKTLTELNKINPDYQQHNLPETRIDVNEYHFRDHFDGECESFLEELVAAMKGENYFNHDDSMTDYFHRSHYISIRVGTYDKPYQLID